MARRWLYFILVVSLGNLGFGADSPKTTSLKLLDVGQQPRRELRYHYKAGNEATMEMALKMSLAQKLNGKPMPKRALPEQILTMALSTEEVADDGNAVIRSELKGVQVAGDGVSQAILDAVRSKTESLVGLTTVITVSPRGQKLESKVHMPEGTDDQIKQDVASIERSLAKVSVLMPEKPVGLGAKWKVATPITKTKIHFVQEVVYTVTKISDDSVTLSATLRQTAPEQDIAVGDGTKKVHMESFQGSGNGTMTINFARLLPTSTMTTSNTNVMVAGPQNMKIKTTVGVTIHVKPKGH